MSKTDELLGKLGKQMRDFPQVTTFAGAKQAEQAITQGVEAQATPLDTFVSEKTIIINPPAGQNPQNAPSTKPKKKSRASTGGKAVRNFSVTLHQSDIDTMQELRFLVMKEAGKPTVSISETIRIALRAFRSTKTLREIIAEVEDLDGRGMWRNK